MKIKLLYLKVFMVALGIGYLSVIPFPGKPAMTETVKLATSEIRPVTTPQKSEETPQIFDIDHIFAEWPEEEIEMLEPGQGWRLEEIKVRKDEKLLGLYHENGRAFLKYSKVKITNDEEGWKNISVDHKNSPRFLLRKTGMLKEGKVTTVFSGFSSFDDELRDGYETNSFQENTIRQFRLDDSDPEYTFRVQKGLSRSKDKVLVLLLEDGETSQVINFAYYSDSEEPYLGDNLLWAGDLDHDNKLDFYLEFYNEKGGYRTGLFLSSKAEKGKLVKLVGGFTTLGC